VQVQTGCVNKSVIFVCATVMCNFDCEIYYNNIYFAKGQVNEKGKSPSKLATTCTLAATKQNKNKKQNRKNYATNI